MLRMRGGNNGISKPMKYAESQITDFESVWTSKWRNLFCPCSGHAWLEVYEHALHASLKLVQQLACISFPGQHLISKYRFYANVTKRAGIYNPMFW